MAAEPTALKSNALLKLIVEQALRCSIDGNVVEIASAIDAADGLKFSGLQAYQGAMQHLSYNERKAKIEVAVTMVADAVARLSAVGLLCDIVGVVVRSYIFEGESGVYNELQCGSYAFMDADYGQILDSRGKRIDQGEWQNALFVLTSVMSHAKPDTAICDAGLKVQSVDGGLPFIFGRDDIKYVKCTDEHGVIDDPDGILNVGDKLKLVPGIVIQLVIYTTGMSGFATARLKSAVTAWQNY